MSKKQKLESLEEGDYPLEEDKELIRANKKLYLESNDLIALSNSSAGRKLIEGLKGEIQVALQNLFETRQGRYISDLEAKFNLLTKITSAKTQAKAIEAWVDSLE